MTRSDAQDQIDAFLSYLERRGRSPYTIRSYGFALRDFHTWLKVNDIELEDVTRVVIEAYIDHFRVGIKGGAVRPSLDRAGQVNALTRKSYPTPERKPRTINHRVSVLTSFFAYLINNSPSTSSAAWSERSNPVGVALESPAHGMTGRDAPRRRRRAEFRMRTPRALPRDLDHRLAEEIIETAVSARDKALLTLLYRTGQRIGDWCGGRGHGVLGMRVTDLDEASSTIVVRLKGARDEHRVPITDDFWPLYRHYLENERGEVRNQAAWVGLRRGRGKPLTYSAFESSLRHIGGKLGANVNAHMFRHTVARAVVETSGLKQAQELLGHAHITTTADTYARVDHDAMVRAIEQARSIMDLPRETGSRVSVSGEGYVFTYDEDTIAELDAVADPGTHSEHPS